MKTFRLLLIVAVGFVGSIYGAQKPPVLPKCETPTPPAPGMVFVGTKTSYDAKGNLVVENVWQSPTGATTATKSSTNPSPVTPSPANPTKITTETAKPNPVVPLSTPVVNPPTPVVPPSPPVVSPAAGTVQPTANASQEIMNVPLIGVSDPVSGSINADFAPVGAAAGSYVWLSGTMNIPNRPSTPTTIFLDAATVTILELVSKLSSESFHFL